MAVRDLLRQQTRLGSHHAPGGPSQAPRLARDVLRPDTANVERLRSKPLGRELFRGRAAAMQLDFSDQVVIITGAGSGIGKSAAIDFAKAGSTTICVDVSGADTVAGEIVAGGGRAEARAMDVRDAVGWTTLVADITARHGKIDVLVNNAGVAVAGDTAIDVSEAVWDKILDINAKGVWLGMRAVLPGMVERRSGKNCNVASTAAHIGLRDAAASLRLEGSGACLDPSGRRPIRAVQRANQFSFAGHHHDRVAARCDRGAADSVSDAHPD